MNHLTTITWLQWILIEAGALLQVVAIVALIKQKLEHRILPQHGHQMAHADNDEMAPNHSNEEDPAHEYHGQSDSSHRGTTLMNARNLTKTAKVPFKQTFKFR